MPKLIKISFLTCFISTFSLWGWGQNLVPNGSFEQFSNCPDGLNDFSQTNFWIVPTLGSPDYFHTCTVGDASVPNNIFGSQTALSGSAYIGITVYDTFDIYSYREYIQVQLQQTLISGQKYWVSFNASLSDLSIYAIQELGAYFSPTQINDMDMDTTLSFTPQIEFNNNIVTNKNNWTKITSSFTATGNEDYLIIGNFNRKQATNAILVGNGNQNFSYYYIDDVCVSSDSLTCVKSVSISESMIDKKTFNVYPNTASDFFYINNTSNQTYNLAIYNSLGQILFEETNISTKIKKINISNIESNLLFINISTENQSLNYKLLKE